MKTIAEFAKQLREELLEVLNHAHTKERDQKSVFYRRTSLKPVQRKARVYIHEGGSHHESGGVRDMSHYESTVSNKSL